MAAATGYHCARCGMKVDSTGVTHTDPKGNTVTMNCKPLPVANNWPDVRLP